MSYSPAEVPAGLHQTTWPGNSIRVRPRTSSRHTGAPTGTSIGPGVKMVTPAPPAEIERTRVTNRRLRRLASRR